MTKQSTKSVSLKGPAPARKEIKLEGALASIDKLTEAHAANHTALVDTMSTLDSEINQLKAKYLPMLRKQSDELKKSHATLSAAIQENAAEFASPRTRTFHGFKVGMRKLEGQTTFTDEARTIELIEKHFPDQADVLIATKRSVVKDAAAQLAAADLKKIGGQITDAVDQVVIKAATGDVEKLVDALLKEKAE